MVAFHAAAAVTGHADADGSGGNVCIVVRRNTASCHRTVVDADVGTVDGHVVALDGSHISGFAIENIRIPLLADAQCAAQQGDVGLRLDALVALAAGGKAERTAVDGEEAVALEGCDIGTCDTDIEGSSVDDELSVLLVVGVIGNFRLYAVASHRCDAYVAAVHQEVLSGVEAIAGGREHLDGAGGTFQLQIFLGGKCMLGMSRQPQRTATAHFQVSLAVEGGLLPKVLVSVCKGGDGALGKLQGDALAAKDVHGGTGVGRQAQAFKAYGALVVGNEGERCIGSGTGKDIGDFGCCVGIVQTDMLPVRLHDDAGRRTSDARCGIFRPFHIYGCKVVRGLHLAASRYATGLFKEERGDVSKGVCDTLWQQERPAFVVERHLIGYIQFYDRGATVAEEDGETSRIVGYSPKGSGGKQCNRYGFLKHNHAKNQ